ncbi:hypothetical protein BjapCC829_08200 [Bradyrhizobium barranii]|uniref:Hydroxymethylglutaryl-CoA lyase n=1 Tax=Bradyrhizobium barranii TaxID=2992140 RepID=A0ABY3QR37_9BRAD|nr:hypothetical protein [Bradyrhizobium japonicum]UFW88472.1 hypothetical protein BjapCC829_08200 [Bradyrhizobium japonicum]
MTRSAEMMVIQEVAPRDGLQIEPRWVETSEKVQLIERLALAGFSRIEVSSFVSPKAVPARRTPLRCVSRRLGGLSLCAWRNG